MLIHNIQSVSQYTHLYIYTYTWLVVSTLWKIWVRQLGWWNSQYIWKHKKCSKPPTSLYIYTLYDIQFSIVKQNPTFVSTLAAGCFMTIVSHLPSLLASSDKKSMAGCQQPSSCIKGAIFLRGSLLVPMFCSWKLPNCSQSLWFFESTTVNVYIYICIYTHIKLYLLYMLIYIPNT